jgi:creatinine amidohydrolase/Fe(II)-dependent formamide hydrolase-like protein
VRVRDLNWMQLETYLERDDRIVLPLGSTEQHAHLSLETDNILAERVAVEAAEPLGVAVLRVLAYGLTPSFARIRARRRCAWTRTHASSAISSIRCTRRRSDES